MNITVERGRFLSVSSDPEERIVFDRKENKYHLLRESAARLWDQVGEGGDYDVESSGRPSEEDPIAQLLEAGLISLASTAPGEEQASRVSRRAWMRRTGQAAAVAIVLPLVATVSTPGLVLGTEGGLDCSPLGGSGESGESGETGETGESGENGCGEDS